MAERVKLEKQYFQGKPGPGRPKGSVPKHTRLLREAVILAAEAYGYDGKGKWELVGYLRMLAGKHPDLFVSLLQRVLPMQIIGAGADGSDAPLRVELTLPQLEERLKARGLPVLAYDPPVEVIDVTFERLAEKVRTNGHAE